jgi:hypothetical protein
MSLRRFLSRRSSVSPAIAAFGMLLAGIPASASSINLVQNGSFETTTLTGSNYLSNTAANWSTNSYTFLVFPGTAQTGIGNGVTLYRGITYLMPTTSPDGGNFVAADGGYQVGPISQTINGLVVGQYYQLSFYQAGAQQQGYDGATTDQFQVTLGSQVQSSALMSNPSHDFSPWTKQTMLFQATQTSEVLSFLAVGTPTGQPPFSLLDGVVLIAAPEPSYLGVVSAAFIGLVIYRRRLQQRRLS